ncbi:regulator of G protein signaling superfamily [Neoconidiobolus thromboides FSU 785]|nr:regulator of G protein signaling superfamily [Neoconidiobolus thromboides FSU 785]
MYLIKRFRNSLAIRTRGYSITILLTVNHYFIVFCLALKILLQDNVPCSMKLWVPGLLLPLWGATLLARFLRVLFLHRVNQLQLKLSAAISTIKPKDIPGIDLSPNDCTKQSNLNVYVDLQNSNYVSLFPSSNSSTQNSKKKFPKIDSWLYENRIWFTSRGLTLCLLGFLFFNVVLTLLFQIFSSFSKTIAKATPLGTKCPNQWTIFPSLGITALMLIMEWPVFVLLIKGMYEAFGVRLELVANLILAPSFLIIYTLDAYMDYDTDDMQYKLFTFLFIGLICLMHVFTVGYPLLWSRYRIRLCGKRNKVNKRKSILPVIKKTNDNSVNDLKSGQQNELTLKQILENQALFNDFKMFAAHNFCVENVLFYERFHKLKLDQEEQGCVTYKNGQNDGALSQFDTLKNGSTINLDETICPNAIRASETNNEDWQTTLRSQYTQSMGDIKRSDIALEELRKQRQSVPTQPQELKNESNNTLSIRETPSFSFNLVSSSIDVNCATPQTPQQYEVLALYRDFIAKESAVQVNLTGFTKKQIQEKLKQGILIPEIYNIAYEEVYSMLLQDIFPRYLTAIQNGRPRVID